MRKHFRLQLIDKIGFSIVVLMLVRQAVIWAAS